MTLSSLLWHRDSCHLAHTAEMAEHTSTFPSEVGVPHGWGSPQCEQRNLTHQALNTQVLSE